MTACATKQGNVMQANTSTSSPAHITTANANHIHLVWRSSGSGPRLACRRSSEICSSTSARIRTPSSAALSAVWPGGAAAFFFFDGFAGAFAGAAGVSGAARRDVGGAPLAAVDGVAAALCVRPARRIAVLVLGLARSGGRVAGPRRVFGQRARRRRAGGRRPARVDLARAPQERAGGAPRVAPRGRALQGRGRAAALRLPRGLLRRRL